MAGVNIRDRREPLARLFAFDEAAPDRFTAPATGGPVARLYGGQVIAQALAAAQRTVTDDRLAHSCHAYFVRGADPLIPIEFAVERDSDGRSFSARRVAARQAGRLVLSLAASFHIDEPGAAQSQAMPDVPPPELVTPQDVRLSAIADRLPLRHQGFWLNDIGVEFRSVEQVDAFDPAPQAATRHIWLRLRHGIGDDMGEHQRLLAFASDLYLLHTALLPLGIGWADARLQDASLDHAIWFHDRFRIDEWLLYVLDSPAAGHARALARGSVFSRDGRLVASVAQEGLIRMPPGQGAA